MLRCDESPAGIRVGGVQVTSVAAEGGGQWMATASRDGTVRVWEVSTARCARTWRLGSPALAVAWCPAGGLRILSAATQHAAHLLPVGERTRRPPYSLLPRTLLSRRGTPGQECAATRVHKAASRHAAGLLPAGHWCTLLCSVSFPTGGVQPQHSCLFRKLGQQNRSGRILGMHFHRYREHSLTAVVVSPNVSPTHTLQHPWQALLRANIGWRR